MTLTETPQSSVPPAVREEVRAAASRAREASRVLVSLSAQVRNGALEAMAAALEGAESALLTANREDLAAAAAREGAESLAPATLARLRLDEGKLREMVDQVRSVAELPDPLGRVLAATEMDDADPLPRSAPRHGVPGLQLEKVSVPLGVLAVIFEARPDAVTQIAALALKSGNAVLLKPGSEVERTAAALVRVLQGALAAQGLPTNILGLLPGREQVRALLEIHDLVDMVIPRGSKALVEFVQANTRIPVLGHSEGICHIYVERTADPELALRVIADAKLDYPAACNAVETVLIDREIAPAFVPRLARELTAKGVRLRGDPEVQSLAAPACAAVAPVLDWHCEYGEPELAIGIVSSPGEAIEHIHTHGSRHTETILTEDAAVAERFLREVDAAGVFLNVSTRFADGFRYGFGAEVGISTSKLHARGPVGLEGLTTYKYCLRGHGHVAGDYRGAKARSFTHRPRPRSA